MKNNLVWTKITKEEQRIMDEVVAQAEAQDKKNLDTLQRLWRKLKSKRRKINNRTSNNLV